MNFILDTLYQNIISFSKKACDTITNSSLETEFYSPKRKTLHPEENLKLSQLSDNIIFSSKSFDSHLSLEKGMKKPKKRSSKRNVWDSEYENLLVTLVKTYKRDWKRIRQRFNTQTGKHFDINFLKEKYNELTTNSSQYRKHFTEEEDQKLSELVETYGHKWMEVARNFEQRDWFSVKNRFYYLQRKKQNPLTDEDAI